MKKHFILMVSLMMMGTLSACSNTSNTPNIKHAQCGQGQPQEYVAKSVLVVFAPNSNYQATIADIESQHENVRFKRRLMDSGNIVIGEFSVPEGKECAFMRILERHPNIQSAELNAIMRIANHPL